MPLAVPNPMDSDLAARVHAGDEAAYEELFHRYYRPLCRFAARIDPSPGVAEEIVQDVFLKVWLRRDRLVEIKALGSYLYTAVRNQALNQQKRETIRERWREETEIKQQAMPAMAPSADEEVRVAELSVAIDRALEALPPRCRQAYLLQRREHMTVAEIARVMEIAPKTVEIQLGNALKMLRRSLAEWIREV
jgi:RNA polymerase sigma-70 factor (ECF subfamily)